MGRASEIESYGVQECLIHAAAEDLAYQQDRCLDPTKLHSKFEVVVEIPLRSNVQYELEKDSGSTTPGRAQYSTLHRVECERPHNLRVQAAMHRLEIPAANPLFHCNYFDCAV